MIVFEKCDWAKSFAYLSVYNSFANIIEKICRKWLTENTMRILYIFPHPDDESFGPAPAISLQRRQGHEVYLLTLTRGEATKERLRLGFSKEKMGELRYLEMQAVAKVLDLSELIVLDLPDNQLKEMDPRKIEDSVQPQIQRIKPHVLVTYAVHGISGFQDHLVIHPVVKRLYLELRESGANYLQRLAFFTLDQSLLAQHQGIHNLKGSSPEEIDCVLNTESVDMERFQMALDCYTTYQETIRKSGVRTLVTPQISFELYQESFDPPINDLFTGLNDA